ncbi:MAG TPA: hypothetical protein VG148_19580 [Pyrinomonadaceae bacterium]|nr:hypothetical protein [Pyrinomonadaceae bacterium]
MGHATNDTDENVRAVAEVLARRGLEATGGRDAFEAAREWVEEGFDDAEEVESWLGARCFEAAAARRLEEAGVTPEQAALRTRAGDTAGEDTLGRKLSRGEISLEEARRIITREFWGG